MRVRNKNQMKRVSTKGYYYLNQGAIHKASIAIFREFWHSSPIPLIAFDSLARTTLQNHIYSKSHIYVIFGSKRHVVLGIGVGTKLARGQYWRGDKMSTGHNVNRTKCQLYCYNNFGLCNLWMWNRVKFGWNILLKLFWLKTVF